MSAARLKDVAGRRRSAASRRAPSAAMHSTSRPWTAASDGEREEKLGGSASSRPSTGMSSSRGAMLLRLADPYEAKPAPSRIPKVGFAPPQHDDADKDTENNCGHNFVRSGKEERDKGDDDVFSLLQSRLQAQQRELQNHRSDIQRGGEQLGCLASLYDDTGVRLKSLTGRNIHLQDLIASLRKSLAEAQEQRAVAEAEVADLKTQLKNLKQSSVEAAQSQAESVKLLTSLQDEIARLTQQKQEAFEASDAAKQANTEKQKEADEVRRELEALKKQFVMVQSEKETLQQNVAAARGAARREISKISEQLQQRDAEVKVLMAEAKDNKKRDERFLAHGGNLKENLLNLRGSLMSTKTAVADSVQGILSDLKVAQSGLEDMHIAVIDRMQSELDDAKSKEKLYAEEIKILSSAVTPPTNVVESAVSPIKALMQANSNAIGNDEAEFVGNTTSTSTTTSTTTRVTKQTKTVEPVHKHQTMVDPETRSSVTIKMMSSKTVTSLETQLKTETETRTKLETELRVKKAEHALEMKKNEAQAAQLREMRESASAMKAKTVAAQAAAKEERKRADTESSRLTKTLEQTRNQLEQAHKQLERGKKEEAKLGNDLCESKKQVQQSRSDLKKKESELVKALTEIDELKGILLLREAEQVKIRQEHEGQIKEAASVSDALKALEQQRMIEKQEHQNELERVRVAEQSLRAELQTTAQELAARDKQLSEEKQKAANALSAADVALNDAVSKALSTAQDEAEAKLQSSLAKCEKHVVSTIEKLRREDSSLEAAVTCMGCMQPLHNAVMLLPCCHSLCGDCAGFAVTAEGEFSTLPATSMPKCPECDDCTTVEKCVENKLLDIVVEKCFARSALLKKSLKERK